MLPELLRLPFMLWECIRLRDATLHLDLPDSATLADRGHALLELVQEMREEGLPVSPALEEVTITARRAVALSTAEHPPRPTWY
jgi:hypothetical protein